MKRNRNRNTNKNRFTKLTIFSTLALLSIGLVLFYPNYNTKIVDTGYVKDEPATNNQNYSADADISVDNNHNSKEGTIYTARECVDLIDEIMTKASKGKDNPMASLGGFASQLADVYEKHENIKDSTERLDNQLEGLDSDIVKEFNRFQQDFTERFEKIKEAKANQNIDEIINNLESMLILTDEYQKFLDNL